MTEARQPRWIVRPFGHGDLPALARLYEIVNGREFDESYWKWLFEDHPAGRGEIWLAVDGNVIAGQYATMAARMQVRGKIVTAAQSLHTMTHPGYRRQGIFTALALRAYDQLEQRGTQLVYGFPNDSSFHGFVKHLDFSVVENLPMRIRPLRLEALLKENRRLRRLSRWASRSSQQTLDHLLDLAGRSPAIKEQILVKRVPAFTSEIDQLARMLAHHFPNAIVRDREYLNWRYVNHPSRSYAIHLGFRRGAIAGCCVCGRTRRRGTDIGLIMELSVDPSDGAVIDRLLSTALNHMRRKNMALAACVLPSRSPFQRALKRHGFWFTLRRFPYIVRRGLRAEAGLGAPGSERSWHITFGDADFV